jgi:hypothetical protein
MTASLTRIETRHEGERVTRLVVDCRHGTTTGYLVGPAPEDHERVTVRLLLARHFDAEGCRCTLTLRRRYGVPLGVWP